MIILEKVVDINDYSSNQIALFVSMLQSNCSIYDNEHSNTSIKQAIKSISSLDTYIIHKDTNLIGIIQVNTGYNKVYSKVLSVENIYIGEVYRNNGIASFIIREMSSLYDVDHVILEKWYGSKTDNVSSKLGYKRISESILL